MSRNFRAYVVTRKNFAETTSLPLNLPREDEVEIEIVACGLNYADLLMLAGDYQETPPYPFAPGLESVGQIVSVGASVADFKAGDRVIAFAGHGGLAERQIVPAARCRKIPDSLDDVTAAGFQIAYGTSHLALTRRAALASGETLVVLGAAGGVGLTAVEVGKVLGARVIGVARGAEKTAVVKAAGADIALDSTDTDLKTTLKELGPIDVVYDAVGGEMGEAALRALGPEGRHLLIGFASGTLPRLRPNHMLVKNLTVIGFYWGGYMGFRPDLITSSMDTLIDWHAKGRIKPHVSHVLPFDRIDEGLQLLKTRQATGKIVITI